MKRTPFMNLLLIVLCLALMLAACGDTGGQTDPTNEQVNHEGGLTVTFVYNDDATENSTVSVASGEKVTKPNDPSRSDADFEGWYTDEALTQSFSFNTAITEDITLYAKWAPCFVFEAEYTYVTPLVGSGFSGEASGTDIILDREDASNGWFITYLYKNGMTLEFVIESSAAVDDATLIASLSAELMDITIGTDTYQFIVNGEVLTYNDISFVDVPSQTDHEVYPFQDYVISTSVSLQEGTNIIQLVTNNSDHMMGTMNSTAPMVDCIKIKTSATLSWDPLTENLDGKVE